MYINRIETASKNRYRICIDGMDEFILYKADIEKYGLKENSEICTELYETIINETVFRRAKQKALLILKKSDKTEKELKRKLCEQGYSDAVAEKALEYVKSYHYVDDRRYAEVYIRYHSRTKSRKELLWNLKIKGVDKDIIDEAITEYEKETKEIEYIDEEKGKLETEAIKNCIRKKLSGSNGVLTQDKKKSLMQYLYRRGFEISSIREVLDGMNIEEMDSIDRE